MSGKSAHLQGFVEAVWEQGGNGIGLGSHLGYKSGELHAAIRKMQSAISYPILPGD